MAIPGLTAAQWGILAVYVGFMVAASLLALARRWVRPKAGGESVWGKYPTYIVINIGFIAASWLPANWHVLTGLLALIGGLAAWEIAQALLPEQNEKVVNVLLAGITTLLIVAADAWEVAAWLQAWLVVLLLLMIYITLRGEPARYARQALALAACTVYLPICLAAYVWLRQSETAGFEAVFLYLTVATNDALAQITGQLFGKRPLAPRISPAKTVEGFIGGLVFAGAMGLALGSVLGWNIFQTTILGLLLGLAGPAGDLTASKWKRALGLKNFSGLLGAQGGVLDRFDSLILAAPIFYILMTWLPPYR